MAKRKSATDALLKVVVDAILNKKGHDVLSLDLRKIKDTPSDYFVITHGDSSTHVKALYDNILAETEANGFKPYQKEGGKGAEWMIIDFVDVTVHIFYKEKREFYELEDLWSDAKIIRYREGVTVK